MKQNAFISPFEHSVKFAKTCRCFNKYKTKLVCLGRTPYDWEPRVTGTYKQSEIHCQLLHNCKYFLTINPGDLAIKNMYFGGL